MATFSEIRNVRLAVRDPYIFIDLIEVATTSLLPAAPAHQAAYKVIADSVYYSTIVESGASLSDYTKNKLYVSDATLTLWIDDKGVEYAKCQALKAIVGSIGGELRLKAHGAGAERTEYTELKSLLDYYKALLSLCNENYNESINNNSGTFGEMKQPEIAGGNL